MLDPLPPTFAATRDALHAVAEHVLSPARYRAEQHIGLVPTPGGFGTPRYGDDEVARVDGTDIVHEGPSGERRAPLTTLAVAAEVVGGPLGAPSGVYEHATPCDADAPLAVDREAAAVLAAWLARADSLLDDLGAAYAAHNPSTVQLWPEHFDLGFALGDDAAGTRGNYGASLGDAYVGEPYLYVGPWEDARRTGVFAVFPFGAALTYHEMEADPEGRGSAFFTECAELLLGA